MTIRFRNSLAPLLVALALGACASDSVPNNNDAAPPTIRPAEEGRSRADALFPPANWWHDEVATAVALNGDQVKQLDVLQDDQGAEVARLERDLMLAVRDVRSAFDQAQPSDEQITSSGERLRQLRDALFERQLTMLAAERKIVTADQWHTLEDAMQARNHQRPDGQRGQRPGGMGGRGGRRGGMGGGMGGGRWPGGQ
jgi:hypothetical protein